MGKFRDAVGRVKAELAADMLGRLIKSVILPEEVLKKSVDAALDVIEDYYKGTDNRADDMVYGGIAGAIRQLFDIPDEDEPPATGEGM